MRSDILRFLLPLLLVLPASAFAQDDPAAPVMPDIAPRVVEIRGDLEIVLPSLRRQPLIGFNPPPAVTPIPASRRPFVTPYKQSGEDLPPSPLRPPEPPAVSALTSLPPRGGELEASAGRYFSRVIRARTEMPLTGNEAVYGRLDYRGSEGHTTSYDDETRSNYDTFGGLAGLQTTRRQFTAGAEMDGFLNSYNLYGAAAGAAAAGLRDTPSRTGAGGGAGVWLRTQGETPVALHTRIRAGAARISTDAVADNAAEDPHFERTESRLDAEADLRMPFGARNEGLLDAAVSTAGLDSGTAGSGRAVTIDGGAGLRFRFGSGMDLAVGARILAYSAPGRNGDESAGATYVAPDVRLNLYPGGRLTVYVRNTPGADLHGLTDLYEQNPFLVDQPIVQPTVSVINAEGGATAYSGPVKLEARAGYQRSPNYLFFEHATEAEAGGYSHGFTAARFASAEILRVAGDLSVVLPAGFHAAAGITLRRGQLTETEEDIPNFGSVLGRGALSYSFARRRGLFQVNTTYESARYRDREETRLIGYFLDIDVRASYNILPGVGLVLRLENLADGYLERWDRYEQSPILMGGFRLLW